MTPADKNSLFTLSALSQTTYESTRAVMEGLAVALLLAYHEKQAFHISEIGDVSIEYRGDLMTDKGRKADIVITLEPDNFIIKNIGQIEDGDQGVLLQRFQKRIQDHLKKLATEEIT